MPRSSIALRLLVSGLVVVSLGSCGSSGRELRAPEPGQTAPPRKQSAAGAVTSTSPTLASFGLTSDALSLGGPIPSRFTCDGVNVSPPFAIFTPPTGSVELALVVTDLDNEFVHWIVTGIAPVVASMPEGGLPDGAVEATNSSGAPQWSGPCPPEGEEHIYEFALYALGAPSGVTADQSPEAIVEMLSSAPLELATFTGSYLREDA
jgi:Raf kinase inhibitor-like YbhB/YbcL family protein